MKLDKENVMVIYFSLDGSYDKMSNFDCLWQVDYMKKKNKYLTTPEMIQLIHSEIACYYSMNIHHYFPPHNSFCGMPLYSQ